jgi:putative oxidoreductase
MTVSRRIARPMIASMFVVGGVNALRNAPAYAEKAKVVTDRLVPLAKRVAPEAPIPEDPVTLVRVNGAIHVGAGVALATGHFPRLASTALAATLVPTTLAGHQFWNESDPAQKANHRVHFFKNVSMLGGLLLAAVDTEGKPGVAWRTRHTARDVRREARHLRATARREAKLAAAQLR